MTAIRFVERDQTPAPDPVVLIVSSAYSSLPSPGNRVGPGDAANMPKIVAPDTTDGNPAITTATGAHHYRLVGLNIETASTNRTYSAVQIGGGETALNQFATDITLDRCIVRNVNDSAGARRGIAMNAIRGAVIDSYIYNFKESGADTQGVWWYNSPGPIKIVNNYLEAAGENLLVGGSDPNYADCVPSDIEIRRNYLKKQTGWHPSWTVKNLLEFKNAQRVLVEGNVLDTNYGASQNGIAVLITPRNQNGGASWCTTRDITIRYNKITNVEGGFNISGTDGEQTSQRTYRLDIKHNYLMIANLGGGGDLRAHVITAGPVDLQMMNNTWLFTATGMGTCGFHENNPDKADRTIWRNNVFMSGLYGILGTSSGTGSATFTAWFTNHEYNYNVMVNTDGAGTSYGGTGNQFPTTLAATFTNFAGADYTLTATYQGDGSDGLDPGCNWTTLNSKTANAIDGQWGSEHATYATEATVNAELPRSYINTTYTNQAGNTWTATNTSSSSVAGSGSGNRTGCSLSYALANCAIGDIIEVTAGSTYTVSAPLTLRAI